MCIRGDERSEKYLQGRAQLTKVTVKLASNAQLATKKKKNILHSQQ